MQIDTNLERKEKLVYNSINTIDDLPIFSLIEFNITDLCNRKCSFCPRYDEKLYPNSDVHMDIELYKRIMKDLKRINYKGVILFSAYGEPLLYKEIYKLLRLTKKYCPDCHLEIITNGDLATDKLVRQLFKSGLDTLLFSLYDGKHQIKEVENLKERLNLNDEQIKYRIRYNKSNIILSNRAGMIEEGKSLKLPLKKPCLYPFYQITIDWDGSVPICPHDWNKSPIVGIINGENILDVWNSHKFNKVRKALILNDRDFKPCNKCNVDGTLMGWDSFKLWKKYYERN